MNPYLFPTLTQYTQCAFANNILAQDKYPFLRDNPPAPKQYKLSPLAIIEIVATELRIPESDVIDNKRKKVVIFARQLCYYFFWKILGMSKTKVSIFFNHTDHTSVLHGIEMIESLQEFSVKHKTFIKLNEMLNKKP
jgi:chromosomal replication initiation ATPase DnaA